MNWVLAAWYFYGGTMSLTIARFDTELGCKKAGQFLEDETPKGNAQINLRWKCENVYQRSLR